MVSDLALHDEELLEHVIYLGSNPTRHYHNKSGKVGLFRSFRHPSSFVGPILEGLGKSAWVVARHAHSLPPLSLGYIPKKIQKKITSSEKLGCNSTVLFVNTALSFNFTKTVNSFTNF